MDTDQRLERNSSTVTDRKATIRDVAAAANVSLAAVSLYLNDKPGLADATRQRIASAIDAVGYVPRNTNNKKPAEARFIGLLVESLPLSPFFDMFYGEVIQGIDTYAKEMGYTLALIIVEPGGALPNLLRDQKDDLAGVIMLGSGDVNQNIIDVVQSQKIPAVLVDNHLPGVPLDSVLPDNLAGANMAVRYLIEKGNRRIAFLHGSEKYYTLQERYRGYYTALFEAGLPIDPALIQPYLSAGQLNKGYLEMKALLDAGTEFDAVFCVTDRTAFGALQALKEAHIRVPDDVMVVGYDNVAQSSQTTPALTTIDVPKRTMGEIAMSRLFESMSGPPDELPMKYVLPTSLVIRDSA